MSSSGTRRSAKEWSRLLDELERSGESPTAFARVRGIRPDTLKWWRWRLGRKIKAVKREKAKPAASRRRSNRVELIAVRPINDSARERASTTPVWEIISPTGHELRVYHPRGLGILRAALSAVAGTRRR